MVERAKYSQDIGPPSEGESVRQYLSEIGQYPLLTPVQEVEYAIAIERGKAADALLALKAPLSDNEIVQAESQSIDGWEAYTGMVHSNLRLVVGIAAKYLGHGIGLSDLIQEGNFGLLRAVDKFDHRRGNKFSTYATWWIRQKVTRVIVYQSRSVRLPINQVTEIKHLNDTEGELYQTLGRTPNIDDLAQALEITPNRIMEMNTYALNPISLDTAIQNGGGDDDDSLVKTLFDQDAEDPQAEGENSHYAKQFICTLGTTTLNRREIMALALRFGLGDGRDRTLGEVGDVMGVTRERARQIVSIALNKLREPQNSRKLAALVG